MNVFPWLKKTGLDPFLLMLIATVALATLLPASGASAIWIAQASYLAIMALFFVYGAKLNPRAVLAGMQHWRLQGLVLVTTYLTFPLLGLAFAAGLHNALPGDIVLGLIFLSLLPSTVQSSIAFTSLAGGSVPAAVCAATLSNMAAVVLTPLLAALLLQTEGGVSGSAVINIAVQILLPFIAGQLARFIIGDWFSRRRLLLQTIDRGSILLIVYSAFSAGVISGVWQQVSPGDILLLIAAQAAMLAIIIALSIGASRLTGLDRADTLAVMFCGSTKSLATGIPIANILFAGQPVSMVVLPVMIFHQLQIFVCATIAQRQSRNLPVAAPTASKG